MADETKPPTASAPPGGATAGKPAHLLAPSAPAAPRPHLCTTAASLPHLLRQRRRQPPAAPPRSRRRRQDDHRGGDRGEGELARPGRQLAAGDAPHLAGHGLGRVLGGVGRGAGRDRPLHVPERAERAAAAVQGGFSGRLRHGRRRALQRIERRLDRPDQPTTSSITPAASTC